MGGVRGIVEAVLPPFAFLIVYTITSNLFWSVLPPLALAVIFVIVRIVTKSPVMPAIGGLVLTALSAGFALWTGNASDNFVLGFVINGIGLALMLLSLIARRPLLGIVAGFLTGDEDWRDDRAKFRVAVIATLLWVGLFGAPARRGTAAVLRRRGAGARGDQAHPRTAAVRRDPLAHLAAHANGLCAASAAVR